MLYQVNNKAQAVENGWQRGTTAVSLNTLIIITIITITIILIGKNNINNNK